MPDAIDVFISYAPQDAEHLAALTGHLTPLRRQGMIATWDAHDLQPGDDHAAETAKHLERADLVLFLVSVSFLESDDLWEDQLQQALARRASHGTQVVPIIVRPVDWESSELGKLEALPAGGRPITRWDDADAAWTDVVRSLRRMLFRDVRRDRRVRRPRPEVLPEAVPYRVDRDPQIDALRDALRDATATSRPLVAVAWGGPRQGQDALVERLAGEGLRQLLGLSDDRKLHDCFLRWPADWRTRPERLLERLGEEVVAEADAGRVDAAWGEDPVLVYTMLEGDDWRRGGAGAVRAFAGLWRGWPELSPGRALVALLTVELDPPRGMLGRLLRRGPDLGPRLEAALAGDDRVVTVVLPRLGSVERGDARDWARRTARDYGWPADRLRRPVDACYRERSTGALPMDELIDQLRRILDGALFPQETPT